MRPETPQHTGVPNSHALERAGVMRPGAPPPTEVLDWPEADSGVACAMRPEAPQPTEVQEAN